MLKKECTISALRCQHLQKKKYRRICRRDITWKHQPVPFPAEPLHPHAYLPELLDDQSQEKEHWTGNRSVLLSWCDGLIVVGM